MEPRAVIFDLDGTLYDRSRLPLWLILSQLRQGRARMLDRERKVRKKLKGKCFESEEAFYSALFGGMGTGAGDWYAHVYMPATVRILQRHCHLRPWVEETLTGLRQRGIRVAVLSDYGCVREKLEALGFDPAWADVLADAPSSGGLKPCPAPFLAVAQRLGVAPEDCLVVGDRPDTDGAGAAAAGMAFCLISREGGRPGIFDDAGHADDLGMGLGA